MLHEQQQPVTLEVARRRLPFFRTAASMTGLFRVTNPNPSSFVASLSKGEGRTRTTAPSPYPLALSHTNRITSELVDSLNLAVTALGGLTGFDGFAPSGHQLECSWSTT